MSKSILVIDTPNSCSECKLGFLESGGTLNCIENDLGEISEYTYENTCSPQCPLTDTSEYKEALELMNDNMYYKDELSGKPRLKTAMTVENFSRHNKAYNKLKELIGGNDNE